MKQTFDKYTSTLGIPLEERVQCGRLHKGMWNMALGDDLYGCINRQIRKAVSRMSCSLPGIRERLLTESSSAKCQ